MSLIKKEIKKYDDFLKKEKEEVINELKSLKKHLSLHDDNVNSEDEESEETEEFANYIDIKRKLNDYLTSIYKALEKIDQNVYGICEKCSKEISKDVLEANPASKLCKKCKKELIK